MSDSTVICKAYVYLCKRRKDGVKTTASYL